MNQELANRIARDKPEDAYEQIFWYVDRINLQRSCHWPADYLEPCVRELADVIEGLYAEWLRARGISKTDQDQSEYLYMVLPYVSFRFLNSQASKEVAIFKASSDQKRRFIKCMAEELHELSDGPLLRAVIAQSLKTLLSFLESVQLRRLQ
jgi:hypothetical protein